MVFKIVLTYTREVPFSFWDAKIVSTYAKIVSLPVIRTIFTYTILYFSYFCIAIKSQMAYCAET